MDPSTTLAAINHNPLNLRPLPNGEKWNGQTGVSSNPVTGQFCQFVDNAHGVRAGVINMRSIVRLGRRTLRDVINTWAPPPRAGITGVAGSAVGGVDQNDTTAYLEAVCNFANLPPTYDLSWLSAADANTNDIDRDDLALIVQGMNGVEASGHTINATDAHEGIDLAFGAVPAGHTRQDDGNITRDHLAQSETIQSANNGLLAQGIGIASTVGGPAAALASGASWPTVATIGLVGVFALASFAIYYLLKVKADRTRMFNNGIA